MGRKRCPVCYVLSLPRGNVPERVLNDAKRAGNPALTGAAQQRARRCVTLARSNERRAGGVVPVWARSWRSRSPSSTAPQDGPADGPATCPGPYVGGADVRAAVPVPSVGPLEVCPPPDASRDGKADGRAAFLVPSGEDLLYALGRACACVGPRADGGPRADRPCLKGATGRWGCEDRRGYAGEVVRPGGSPRDMDPVSCAEPAEDVGPAASAEEEYSESDLDLTGIQQSVDHKTFSVKETAKVVSGNCSFGVIRGARYVPVASLTQRATRLHNRRKSQIERESPVTTR